MSRFQRNRDAGEEQRATTLELFYDLVFVFAVTQVSHLLLADLSWTGAGEAALCLLVVWWAWNYTTWVTNELDPDSEVVRLVLLVIMLASLVMAIAIPEAFGSRGLLFAGAYVAIQVGRHAFLTFGAASRGSPERRRAGHILFWLCAAGAFWLNGALAHGETRTYVWLVALAIDYTGPIVFYWVPGWGRLGGGTWEVETSHFAERFQLFMIIALGETIVLTGATTSELELDGVRMTALGIAFLGTATLWWLYFDYVASIAERRLALAPNRTLLARDGYTYLHALLVAGVILYAVGDELMIAHPSDDLPRPEVLAIVGGPAIYLLGHALFRLRMAGSVSWKRLAGATACCLLGVAGTEMSALLLGALVVSVLLAVAAAERIAAEHRRGRGEPSPLERLEASAGGG